MFGFGITELFSSIVDLLKASLDFLAPLFALLVAFLGWYFGKLKEALAVIMTNIITLFAIVPLLIGTGTYAHYQTAKKCEVRTVEKLRKDYKFVPKKENANKTVFDFLNPLGWWK